jgi:hypothetical protein
MPRAQMVRKRPDRIMPTVVAALAAGVAATLALARARFGRRLSREVEELLAASGSCRSLVATGTATGRAASG